ncbi:MAG: DUF6587 family protein [Massilia sp.]
MIVALIVVAAALSVARKYLPASWRRKLVYWLAARGASQSRVAAWLNTDTSCGSGCDTCKACAEPASGADSNSDDPRVIKLHRHH